MKYQCGDLVFLKPETVIFCDGGLIGGLAGQCGIVEFYSEVMQYVYIIVMDPLRRGFVIEPMVEDIK